MTQYLYMDRQEAEEGSTSSHLYWFLHQRSQAWKTSYSALPKSVAWVSVTVALMAMVVLGVVTVVTEDLTYSDESVDTQVRCPCVSIGEKTEICVHDCAGSHLPFRRLDVDVYRFLTADTVRQLA
ncbi:hypothetical protein TCE0_042r14211 [Talaromyces pinophilus]|uniref:Uncharacterized protein n=1 Tax=Talaromyces pinophilus TaxID=128442 RepID=A0A6V8HNK2_TALPI|nr:hypothetical protein TCE0_042r14211 [Talaromyces pinophilus]